MPGAIFDWDGIIIDSHDQHLESWRMLFDEEGRVMADDFFRLTFGMRNQNIIPAYFEGISAGDSAEIARLGGRKEELYRELVVRDGIEPLPGVVTLLEALREAGIPCSVGSSTPRKNLEVIMELLGLGEYFGALTAAEDVADGKPDPQVFLRAAEKIGRPPSRCVVFEDAHVGIEAGLRAGMRVVAVATTHPASTLGAAHYVLESLTEARIGELFAFEA